MTREMSNSSPAVAAPRMTGHTPGPWRIFQTTGTPPFYVIGIGRETGEGITDGNVGLGIWNADSPEALANARLISAAPDLLAALTEIMEVLRVHAPGTALNNHRFDGLGIKAYEALAKATKGTPLRPNPTHRSTHDA